MNIYSIYKATNIITRKVYIGFDSNWPHRILAHKSNSKKYKSKLYQSINKHGWSNFQWEVIYQSKDREHTINVMEKFFIEDYDSFKCGYNSTLGGEGTFGKKQSEYNKKLLSESRKGSGNPNYGKKASEETRRKRSQTLTGRKCDEEKKKKISATRKGKKLVLIDGKRRYVDPKLLIV